MIGARGCVGRFDWPAWATAMRAGAARDGDAMATSRGILVTEDARGRANGTMATATASASADEDEDGIKKIGDDASRCYAPIATSTSSSLRWFRARTDLARFAMFPGRARDVIGNRTSSYDWTGGGLGEDARDPVDASVVYRKTLVGLEVCDRRTHVSCGMPYAIGDGQTSSGLRTCAMRIMRSRETKSGDEQCAADFFVIYLHGNACDVGDCAEEAMKLAIGLSSHVIVPEYPGYGVADGISHEESVNTIVKATVKYCVKYLLAPQSRMIIFGRSIGTGPATWLARLMCVQNGAPAGLVLQSPFTSIRDLAARYIGVGRYAIGDGWNIMENLAEVECPVLLLHGDQDEIIPYEHSNKLVDTMHVVNADRVPCKPPSISMFTQHGADHNNYEVKAHIVVPCMKWIRTKVIPHALENLRKNKTAINKEEGEQKWLNPMHCRLVAKPHMLVHERPPSPLLSAKGSASAGV